MNIPQKDTASNTKQPLFAGIDMGAEELILVISKNNKSLNPQTFSNTPSDHARLVKTVRHYRLAGSHSGGITLI